MDPTSSVTEAAVSDAVGRTDTLSWWLKIVEIAVCGFCWDGLRGTRERKGERGS